MTDQTQRLEIATVRAEIGSNITYRFNNDAIDAGGIPTESGDIKNLKLIIKEIEDKASVSTSIYPDVTEGLAATEEGGMFLVQSVEDDEIYVVWRKVGGVAVDTGKRALSSQAVETAADAAQASAAAAALSAQAAEDSAADAVELRADLESTDPAKGSSILGHGVVAVSSIIGLQGVTPKSDQNYVVRSYHAGYNFGAGVYVWVAAQPKSDHDGATIVSPTVPWDGNIATHAAFLAGTGETDPAGTGVFVKMRSGAAVRMSEFGALPGLEHGYIVNAACQLANGGRLIFDVPTGVVSTQVNMPDVITLDFADSQYSFEGDQDFYIYANNTDQLHIIYPKLKDPTDFAGRTKLHRAIRAEYVRLFTLVRPVIDGFSTGVHALFCGTFIFDHIDLKNIKGIDAQYGYGVNTSSDNNFFSSINFDNTDSPGHGRHALYINGSAKNTHLGTLRVKGCVYNPVNTAIDDNVVGVINIGYCDFTNCNTSPLTSRTGSVNLTAQGAGSVGPNGVICTIGEIMSTGSAGGLFTIGQNGYYGSRVGRLVSRSPIASSTNGTAIFHTRSAQNVVIGEIDIDVLPSAGGTTYGAEIRESSNVRIDSIRVGGAVGAAAVHLFDATDAVVGDINSTIPGVLVSGTTTWSRAITDNKFYLIGGGTPSTGGKQNLYTMATPLSITNLLDAADGDKVTIVSMSGATTIVKNDAFIITKSGADVVLGLKKTIQLIKRGSVWLEV